MAGNKSISTSINYLIIQTNPDQQPQILSIKSTTLSQMPTKINSLIEVSHKYSSFFFDLDGVVWRGTQRINSGFDALEYLRKQNKRIYFITNTSVRNRKQLVQRFATFGFNAKEQECYPSSYSTGQYIKSKYPEIKKIGACGTQSFISELRSVGFQVETLPEQIEVDVQHLPSHVGSVDAFVMGFDVSFTYHKLCLICLYLQKGAKFIASNPDKHTIVNGFKMPGNGSMIAAVEAGCGCKVEVAGKPNTFILEYIIERDQLKREECLMIGDNLQTDIEFGNKAKIDTLCVLTGVSNEQMAAKNPIATYYSATLMETKQQ